MTHNEKKKIIKDIDDLLFNPNQNPSEPIDQPQLIPHYAINKNINPDTNTKNNAVTIPGFLPKQLASAYGFSSVVGNPTGSKQICAIIEAYTYPSLISDLTAFCTEFGLSIPVLASSVTGLLSPPTSNTFNIYIKSFGTVANTSWSLEQSLDCQWIHAMAPEASLLIVQAASASDTDLTNAINYAKQNGATVISMSFGGAESSSETSTLTTAFDDGLFTGIIGNQNITFCASAGDSPGVEYPASSPNVLGVGGSTLTLTSTGAYGSEVAWKTSSIEATGGGVSVYEPEPLYQKNPAINQTVFDYKTTKTTTTGTGRNKKTITTTTTTLDRGTPDVAFDANPSTGVPVYNTYYAKNGTWYEVGGTSFSVLAWAAIVLLANQLRASKSLPPLSNSVLQTGLYKLPGTTSGTYTYSNCFNEIGGTNYTLLTGLGSPKVTNLIPYLVSLP
ncbi:MAG: peptidase S8 and S53 subtilisin kexin sedolisin [Terrestrivirus sp.]|uniref:Peptidase S8 and S53 subtilisin kexin sedolisin n=1 Tax=Terrestrivirus sp. TaxID=2487775 RepID=A0A3G4ZQ16_9VIRU|nr:MAG: peptidase S8 and S53 subtilisin kexin sedolisin [Terrestrivirus sp.]